MKPDDWDKVVFWVCMVGWVAYIVYSIGVCLYLWEVV
jgi:hypothetical protein